MKNDQCGFLRPGFKSRAKDFFDPSVLSINDNGKRITLLSIIIPKLIELLYAKLVATVNTRLIAGYSENAVGATTSATQIVNVFSQLLNITTLGATILVSIELGRGNRERAGRIASTSLIMLLLISGVLCSSLFFGANILLRSLNLEGEALEYGTVYLKIRGGLLILSALTTFINTLLICNGKALYTMISGMISSTLNVLFVYLLLYTNIIPDISGTVAIAVAFELACLISLIYSLLVFIKTKCPFRLCFDKSHLGRIYSVGIPGSIAGISYIFAQTITVGFIGGLGIVSLNAYSYISTIVGYTCIGSAILSTSVSVFVGRFAGRGDIASIKKFCRITLLLAVSSNAALSILALIFRNGLLSIFTKNDYIFEMALLIFAIDFIVECFRGIVNILETTLNSTRDVVTTLIAGLISSWGCIVLLSYVFGTVLGLGLSGCWIAFALSEILKATIYIVRFKKKNVIKNN